MTRFDKTIAFSGLALAVALAAATAAAAARPGRSPSPRPDHIEHLATELDLTDAQRAAVEKIFDAHHEEMEQNHSELRAAHASLHAQIIDEDFDEGAIRAAASAVAAVEEEMAVARARMLKEMRGILTADQYKDFVELLARHHRAGRMHGRGEFPGPGPHGHGGPSLP